MRVRDVGNGLEKKLGVKADGFLDMAKGAPQVCQGA
jgi:hypothetical protein